MSREKHELKIGFARLASQQEQVRRSKTLGQDQSDLSGHCGIVGMCGMWQSAVTASSYHLHAKMDGSPAASIRRPKSRRLMCGMADHGLPLR